MTSKENSLNWFEISVSDIERAQKFYEAIFDIKMENTEMMGMKMAMFPSEDGSGKASGSLCQSDMHKASIDGVKLYLNANPSIDTVINRIESNNGKVIMPKTSIGELGFIAFFNDTEGNTIGLHAQN
jgi:predicted enzyme related to lactoylglutathione lyase